MDSVSKADASLSILRRTPVQDTAEVNYELSCFNAIIHILHFPVLILFMTKNLDAISILLKSDPEAVEDLYQQVDSPLKDALDTTVNKRYILIDHNRDEDSFRSPWSNQYFPPLTSSHGFKPSMQLRVVEEAANEIFESYCRLYYGNNVMSSVYLWNKGGTTNEGFAGAFLIKKEITESDGGIEEGNGYWNSIHIVDVGILSNGRAKYELSTTVILSLDIQNATNDNGSTKTNINGSLTKQIEQIHSFSSEENHIGNIGKMIENVEIDLRRDMDSLYIQKTKEVIHAIRSDMGQKQKHGLMATMIGENQQKHNEIQAALMARLGKK